MQKYHPIAENMNSGARSSYICIRFFIQTLVFFSSLDVNRMQLQVYVTTCKTTLTLPISILRYATITHSPYLYHCHSLPQQLDVIWTQKRISIFQEMIRIGQRPFPTIVDSYIDVTTFDIIELVYRIEYYNLCIIIMLT